MTWQNLVGALGVLPKDMGSLWAPNRGVWLAECIAYRRSIHHGISRVSRVDWHVVVNLVEEDIFSIPTLSCKVL